MESNKQEQNQVLLEGQDNGTFMSRLAAAINAGPDKGRKFAARANISYSTLHNYLIGLNVPTMENLIKITTATNADLTWLVTGEGEMYRNKASISQIKPNAELTDTLGYSVDLDEFYFIPRYNIKASAGHGAVVDNEAPMHQMAFRRFWVDNILHLNPKGLAVIGVRGDSMTPVINDKDVILINTLDTSLKDGLYVLRFDNDLIVKRVQKLLNGIVEIASANPDYKTIEINVSKIPDNFAIIGRVVWFGRSVP